MNGFISTTVKGAFKIYLVPATRARNALASVTEGWSDLVAEAREEHEARKHADELRESNAEPAASAHASTASAAESSEQQPSTSPSVPSGGQAEGADMSPSPTLVEIGESAVEVRSNPAISPPHVTSGVIGHVPPEVRHKLAGDGPIRA